MPRTIAPPPPAYPGVRRDWRGYDLYEFRLEGRTSYIVPPRKRAAGSPWAWRATFFDAWPETDLALLARGWHLAFTEVVDLFGCPKAVKHFDRFYSYVTTGFGLSEQVALVAFSRGGLIAYNWAAKNPDKVSCIYADAPVCDFKSWPGGRGKARLFPKEWADCLRAYGFTEAQALRFRRNPVDNLKPLARANVPLIHVCGDSDEVVPMDENTSVLERRYKALGGAIKVTVKPGVGHHPHSLEDVTPIVRFILNAWKEKR